MNSMRMTVLTGVVAVWGGTCMAASQGVIHFSGSIVEQGCSTSARSGSMMELKGCPVASRGSQFDVRPVTTVNAVGNASGNVRLVADSGSGRYYDQRYLVVDSTGKPIQSGNYVVTVTAP
ncbi:hypothetical protein PS664_04768 [Pseudomonas fluorescens]|nr:hypothetical protein PS664_04768 [Pseudomonas fluorescens]